MRAVVRYLSRDEAADGFGGREEGAVVTIDRDKTWAAGQRFLQRGQPDKAIAEFERIAAEDPSDLRAPLKIGDLELQRGNVEGARRNFLRVADAYMAQGFWSKAAALLKQIAHVDAGDVQIQSLLAEVYEKQGLAAESNQQWLLLAQIHDKAARAQAAKAALLHIESLDHGDVEMALAWAQIAARVGLGAEAKTRLTQLAAHLKAEGRHRPWSLVGAHLLELEPQASGLACQLARYHMAGGQPAEALGTLRLAFRASPNDQDVMQLLAEAFEALGQIDKALAVWVELCAQARRRGQVRSLERLLGQVLRLSPTHAEAKAEFERLVAAHGGGVPLARHGVRAPQERAADRALAPSEVAPLLLEARVFHRYRLVTRAREYVARVLAAYPDHAEARALDDSYRQEQAQRRAQRDAAAAPRPPTEQTAPAIRPDPVDGAPPDAEAHRPDHQNAARPAPTLMLAAEPAAPPSAPVAVFSLDVSPDAPPPEALRPPPSAAVMRATLGSSLSSTETGLNVDALDALIAAAASENAASDPSMAPDPVEAALGALAHSTAPDEDASARALQMGVAYKDMDLLGDALAQFEVAKAYPPLAADAWLHTAACLQQKGELGAAMAALDAGLAVPAASDAQRARLQTARSQAEALPTQTDPTVVPPASPVDNAAPMDGEAGGR